jgi:serine/threonine protein kinase
MTRCPNCSGEAPDDSRFCPSCASPLDASGAAPTRTSLREGMSSQPSLDRSRFVPGTMLADRYRIVGLLGRGGMGEVYRADDLKLGQPVALKFLPAGFEGNEHRRSRFIEYVNLARQVSHANVGPLYDVGGAGGQQFRSME